MAFETPEGGFVTELLNSQSSDSSVNLVYQGRTLHLPLPSRSITTATW
jgi:hypothetical protein